jgi:hypothetical protein
VTVYDIPPIDVDDVLPFDDDGAPVMAAPGGTPAPKSALDDALARGPVMAGDWWDTEFEVIEPTLFQVDGAKPLLYPGKSHVFIGEPGRGKSLLGQRLLVELATQDRASLFIDLEKKFEDFRDRIRALGATKPLAQRTGYWRLNGALTPPALKSIIGFCDEWRVSVVVIDSVGRALSRAGLDENNNDDVRRWYDGAVEPLLRAGLTVVLIDHYKKPAGDGGRFGGSPSAASRYAKGAGAKMDVIDGAAYGVETAVPFSRDKAGLIRIVTAKDNNGTRHEGSVAAEARVVPSDGGRRIEVTLVPPEPLPTNTDGTPRWTAIMEQVSRFVEGASTPPSRSKVEAGVNGGATGVRSAIDTLLSEGFLVATDGPRGAKLLTSVRQYRKDADPVTGQGRPVDAARPPFRSMEPF